MRSEGYGTWFVCVCVCLSTLTLSLQAMSGTNVQLKRTKGSKNNVADFAETSAFELERETAGTTLRVNEWCAHARPLLERISLRP